jgi:hypothetical protein
MKAYRLSSKGTVFFMVMVFSFLIYFGFLIYGMFQNIDAASYSRHVNYIQALQIESHYNQKLEKLGLD